jgi:hypothetical protein
MSVSVFRAMGNSTFHSHLAGGGSSSASQSGSAGGQSGAGNANNTSASGANAGNANTIARRNEDELPVGHDNDDPSKGLTRDELSDYNRLQDQLRNGEDLSPEDATRHAQLSDIRNIQVNANSVADAVNGGKVRDTAAEIRQLREGEQAEMKRLQDKMKKNTATPQDREKFNKLFDKASAIEVHGQRDPKDFSFLDGVDNPIEAVALIREKYGNDVADAYAQGVDNQKMGNFWKGLADSTILSPLTAYDWMQHAPKDAKPEAPVYTLPDEMKGKTEAEKEAYLKGKKLEDKNGISNTVGTTLGVGVMLAGGILIGTLVGGAMGVTGILGGIKSKLSNLTKTERALVKETGKKKIVNTADDALPDPNKARINPDSVDELPNKQPASNLSSTDNTPDGGKSPIKDNVSNGTGYNEPIFKKIPEKGFDDLKNTIKKQYGDVDFSKLEIAPIGESGAFKEVFQFKGIKELEGKVLAIGDGLESNLNSYKEISRIAKERPDLNIRIPGGVTKVVEVVHPETGKKATGYFMEKVPNGVESKEIFDFTNSLKSLKGDAKERAIKDMLKLKEFSKNYEIIDLQGILDSKSGTFYLTDAMGVSTPAINGSTNITKINYWLTQLGVKVNE